MKEGPILSYDLREKEEKKEISKPKEPGF